MSKKKKVSIVDTMAQNQNNYYSFIVCLFALTGFLMIFSGIMTIKTFDKNWAFCFIFMAFATAVASFFVAVFSIPEKYVEYDYQDDKDTEELKEMQNYKKITIPVKQIPNQRHDEVKYEVAKSLMSMPKSNYSVSQVADDVSNRTIAIAAVIKKSLKNIFSKNETEDEEIITVPEKEIEEAEKTIEEVEIEVSEKEPQKQEGILKKEITETELKRIIKEEIENSKPKEKTVNTSDNSSKIKAEVIPEKKAIETVQEPPKKKTYKKRVLKVPPADAEPVAGLEEMLSVAEQRSENISEEIKKPSVADRVQKINNSSKRDVILAWRKEHPDGNKTACMKETGASMATVRKWWSLYEEIE